MSEQFDAVVIGGGLLGSITALMFARRGAHVGLLERDQINQHASGQNAGSLHLQLEYRMMEHGLDAARKAAEAMPLHLDAVARWRALDAEFGDGIGLKEQGGLMLAETPDQVELLEAKTEIERQWGLDVQVVAGPELRKIAPYLSPDVTAAAYCPSEGKANTRTAAPTLASAAGREGAQIETQCRVVSITRKGGTQGGWCIEAEQRNASGTPHRREFRTKAVILAAGVWTVELGEMLGVELPSIPLALLMSVTTKRAPLIPHLLQHSGQRLSLKQSHDGNLLIGGGWPARLAVDANGEPDLSARPRVILESLAGNARAARSVVPSVASSSIIRTWVGTTNVAPDQLPHVGAVPGRPGVFVATGGSAFTLGPSFAHALVDLADGIMPSVDLTPYAPNRFQEAA